MNTEEQVFSELDKPIDYKINGNEQKPNSNFNWFNVVVYFCSTVYLLSFVGIILGSLSLSNGSDFSFGSDAINKALLCVSVAYAIIYLITLFSYLIVSQKSKITGSKIIGLIVGILFFIAFSPLIILLMMITSMVKKISESIKKKKQK